jgi:amino acid adenylation domain-containing protein/FkbH-like protein
VAEDLKTRFDQLSPAKRALLERRLRKQNLALRPRDRHARLTPSFSQQRLWFIHQLDPGSFLYNVPRAVRFRGPLDLAALDRSLQEIVRRHEILRTVFPARVGEPQAEILPGLPPALPVTDLSGNVPTEQGLSEILLEEFRRPFDLANGPVMRARLWKLAEDDHVLLLVMHHIASDGITGGIVFEELGALYQAFVSGNAPTLPELPIQYADYAAWQHEQMQGEVLESHLKFWRKHLEGAPAAVDLPADQPRPAVPDFRGKTASILLPAELSSAIKEAQRRHRVTLFPLMMAALKALLFRWSGQDDLVVGTITANRSRPEIEKLIGCFINFLPLRDRLTGDESLEALLQSIHRTVMAGFEHQECPFEKLVEAVNPERSLNANPLFNVALLVQNFPEFAFRTELLEARFLPMDLGIAFLDLRFMVSETAAGTRIDCEYNPGLFRSETIESLLSGYRGVLEQFAGSPGKKLAELALPKEPPAVAGRRRQNALPVAVAATFTAEPVEEYLDFWLRQLNIAPQINFAPFSQVFQQLLDPGSLLAQNQSGLNVLLVRLEDWQGPSTDALESRRQSIARNTGELIAALKDFALRASAPSILCLSPASRSSLAEEGGNDFFARMEQRVAGGLADTPGVHVITSSQVLNSYPVASYDDPYADEAGHIPYTSPLYAALATMIARRLYAIRSAPYKVIVLDCDQTLWKGVCGEDGPLGVEVDAPRRALQEFMLEQQKAGMLLCLCSKNAPEDVAAVFDSNPGMLLRPEHVTASRINWRAKSDNLRELAHDLGLGLDSFVFVDDNPLECAEVRANCPEALVLELPADDLDIPVFLKHVWAFDHWKVTKEDAQRTAMYRQNAEREQLRRGSQNLEEFLRSLNLKIEARLLRETEVPRVSQLTERTNQFNTTTIRRSEADVADLARQGKECLVFELRDRFGDYGLVGVAIFSSTGDAVVADSMLLSCRAFGRRVEHRMLERLGAIAQDRGIPYVDVLFRPTPKNQPARDFLRSIPGEEAQSPDGPTVYRFAAKVAANAEAAVQAPAPGVSASDEPAAAANPVRGPHHNDLLPRVAGNLNTADAVLQAVTAAKGSRHRRNEGYVAPRTTSEEVLADIWARLLRVQAPGVHDNFFALGGHSLMAAQAVARIRLTLGVELPLRSVFECPTIAELARQIEVRRREGQPPLPALKPAPHQGRAPVSYAQQRLWFLDQLEPGNPLYNILQMMRIQGDLKVEILEQSINEVTRRHESLRTTFRAEDTQPVQLIAPSLPIAVTRIDCGHLKSETRETEVQRLTLQEFRRPFDLSKGPLLRATVIRLAEEDHILLLGMHHIVSDRWSMGVLWDELTAVYSALVDKKTPQLGALAVQYADFAVWQRERLSGPVMDQQAAFWKKQLAGAPAVLELPTDRPRPAVQSYRGATCSRLLSRNLVERVAALGQTEGATLFMTLLAAFQTLLARYSGQEDIVVGSPVAGRNHAEVEPLIGFFVNTLALRTDLSGNPTFRELLNRVKDTALNAYANQDIPFEKLVEELQPERSLSYNPVFQVMFALQNAPLKPLQLPGLRVERVPVYPDTSMFDLSWFAIEVPEGLLLRAEFSTDLFDSTTIEHMLEHFEVLVEDIVAHPERHIAELALLSPEEERRILIDFNQTTRPYDDLCLHDLVARKARAVPDSAALIDGERRITYHELNTRANQIAHYLRERGAGPDTPVGIYCERSAELIIGVLGILKAGSAYVPLDPAYPAERIACILEDARPVAVLTQRSLAGGLPAFAGETIALDSAWREISREAETDPLVAVSSENLAYILFTSGSTGRPKGVALEHHSAATFVQWALETFSPEELDGVLFSTSICFDLSVFEVFVTLSAGGKVIIAPNVLHLPSLAARSEVRLINTVPSAMAELVRMGAVPASVRVINLAGEALTQSLADQIYANTGIEKLYNLYGPTEDTTYSTYTLVKRGAPVTIGKPLANTQAYILDPNRKPVPAGVPGELYLAGDGLARGYYGRNDLTSERFVPNPFASRHGSRMYRTGDRCRWLRDGNIEYLGRLDHQVKLRGFRIELGEIETTLERHPAVEQSIALVREDEPGMPRLVAYVKCKPGESMSPDELRCHVRTSLPEFMTPSAFVLLDSFPQTPNGKINRRALPAPGPVAERDSFTAPLPGVEAEIAAIWSEVLRQPAIGRDDNFFALGGHSLLATQVISRLRKRYDFDLPLRAIFENPTLSALAGRVEQTRQQQSAIPPLARIPRDRVLPLSFAQQRLWFLDQLEPGRALYNIPCALRIRSFLDLTILQKSIEVLVERHETLRTRFVSCEGRPQQQIAEAADIPVKVTDLTHLAGDCEAELQRILAAETRQPFDLDQGPLLRVNVLQLGPEGCVLLLVIHHIISDRWSVGVLLRELFQIYASVSSGAAVELPPLPVQYADFAAWQHEVLQGPGFAQQLEYWRQTLDNMPPVLELPTDRQRPAAETSNGGVARLVLSQELTRQLEHLSRTEGVTLFMTLLAGFQALLSRYCGQNDIMVGMPIACRNHPETEGLIGFFANTLPIRARIHDHTRWRDLLQQTKEACLGAYANQDVPFEKLVEELQPERNLSYSPLVQVFFILQNAPDQGAQLAGLPIEPFEADTDTAKGNLFLSLVEREGHLRARLEYNSDLFDAATAHRLLAHYQTLLQSAVSHPDTEVRRLPLLLPEERRQLLSEWNSTQADFPNDLCVHQLLEAEASLNPSRIAASFEGLQIIYGDLNQRANQVAHHLRTLGIGPDDLVGLCVERSLEMLVGLLGILKAGGAYVPVDPSYPRERISFMLTDAGVKSVVTEQALLQGLPEIEAPRVCLDSDWPKIAQESSSNPRCVTKPENLAYVIYTSGSTGKPKGVQIEHRAVVNFLHSMRREPGMTAEDRLLAVATLSFDIAGLEMYLPLMCGAEIVIASRDVASDGNQLLALMQQSGATFMQATPATWRMLLDAGWEGNQPIRIVSGGEALSQDLAQKLRARCAEVWNQYGPTETTIYSTVYRVEPGRVFLGRPIANTQLYVLDRNLELLPAGIPGELYIGGDGLARGYLNRPELTAERFLPDPFSDRPGARMYRTGDLVRWQRDGNLEYLGRTDFQVKLRGFRIELGEIEAVLNRHAAVRQCVVTVREDSPGDKRLAAYLILAAEMPPVAELRAHLKAELPDYMVPSAFVPLERFPLTPNGKVDRKALPKPETAREQSSQPQVPQNPTEEIIAGIWCEVLGCGTVGVDDDFFHLGGHSLLGAQVIARIRQAFHTDMPLRALFEAPTVSQLAKRVAALGPGNILPPIQRCQHNGASPLSFAQQRLWFLDQLEPQNPIYNVSFINRLHGPLQAEALHASLNEIVRRHETLRTRFDRAGTNPVQEICPWRELPMEVIDLTSVPREQREQEARRLATEEVQRPFDLKQGYLLRASLFKLAEDDHALVVNTHHIVSDRWSLGVLGQELAALYEAHIAGRAPALRELPIQYSDYAVWQREQLHDERVREHLAYWKEQLEGAPPVLALPTDRPRSATLQFWGAKHNLRLAEDLASSLRVLSRKHSATLFMTLLAAYQVVLARLAGQDDIVVGTDFANRSQIETEPLIGFFVNLLPMRLRLNGDPAFSEILQCVRESSLGAFAHQELPFERLVEELNPERSLTHNPLVQVLFVMQNTPQTPLEFGGLKLGPLGVGTSSRFELVLFVNDPDSSSPLTTWMYNPALFDAATISRLAGSYQAVLKAVTADPGMKLSMLFAALDQAEVSERRSELAEFKNAGLRKLKSIRRTGEPVA